MPFSPVCGMIRFCDRTDFLRRGKDNKRTMGMGINSLGGTESSTNGTTSGNDIDIITDPAGGTRQVLRLFASTVIGDGSDAAAAKGPDINFDFAFKKPGAADANSATTNNEEVETVAYAFEFYVASSTFTGAPAGNVCGFSLGDGNTQRDFEVRFFQDGRMTLQDRGTSGAVVTLAAGTVTFNQWNVGIILVDRRAAATNKLRLEYVANFSLGDRATQNFDTPTVTGLSTAAIGTGSGNVKRWRPSARKEAAQNIGNGRPLIYFAWVAWYTPFYEGGAAGALDEGITWNEIKEKLIFDPFHACFVADINHEKAIFCGQLQPGVYSATQALEIAEIRAGSSVGTLIDSNVSIPLAATYNVGHVEVTGLSADVEYYYQLGIVGTSIKSAWRKFTTMRTPGVKGQTTFAIIAHLQGEWQKKPYKFVHNIRSHNPRFIVCPGKFNHVDNTGDGAPAITTDKAVKCWHMARLDSPDCVFDFSGIILMQNDYDGGPTNFTSYWNGKTTLVYNSTDPLIAIDTSYDYDNTGSAGDTGRLLTHDAAYTIAENIINNIYLPGYIDPDGYNRYIEDGDTLYIFLDCRFTMDQDTGVFLGAATLAYIESVLQTSPCSIVNCFLPQTAGVEDAEGDSYQGDGTYSVEGLVFLNMLADKANEYNKEVNLFSDAKFTPVVHRNIRDLIPANPNAYRLNLVVCAGKSSSRCPDLASYDANWYLTGNVTTDGVVVPATGIEKAYVALPNSHSAQNDMINPLDGTTQGFAKDDALNTFTIVDVDEVARTIRIRVYDAYRNVLMNDATFGDFDTGELALRDSPSPRPPSPYWNRALSGRM